MWQSKQFKIFLIKFWQPALVGLAAFTALGLLLFFKLGSLVPGFSSPEVIGINSAGSLSKIINNPINAPYKVLQYLLEVLYHPNAFSSRAISALLGIFIVGLFYYVVIKWHSIGIALFTTAMFASSSWFLHNARLATPDVFLLILLASLAYGTWIRYTQHSALVIAYGVILAALLLYMPGLVWFVLIGGFWQRKAIAGHIKNAQLSFLPLIIIGLVILAPLGLAIARAPSLIRPWVGLPLNSLASPYDIFRHILNVPYQLFFRGPENPVYWLGHLPLLDLFTASMFLAGVYAYYFKLKLDRTKLLFGTLGIGTILIGLRGEVSIILLAPFIYFFVAAGISYLLNEWLSVFPRNPLARSIGLSLMIAAISLSCIYNLRHYFVAWPGAPATKQAFRLQR